MNGAVTAILKKSQTKTALANDNKKCTHRYNTNLSKNKQQQQQQQQSQQPEKTLAEKEEDEVNERDKQIMSERIYVDNATPLVSSIFTSLFTVTILYSISTPKDLWILVFLVIDTTFTVIRTIISKYYFSQIEIDDLDKLIIIQFFRFIHTTLSLMLIKILLDIMTFIVLTSIMYWYDYLNIGMVVLCFLFVMFSKLK